MSPAQCRAARGLLDWSQLCLARAANIAQSTVADFEREARNPIPNNLAAMREAFEAAGLTFKQGGVVRKNC
jgi:transcriptional regulator with XRE-family HTH domain